MAVSLVEGHAATGSSRDKTKTQEDLEGERRREKRTRLDFKLLRHASQPVAPPRQRQHLPFYFAPPPGLPEFLAAYIVRFAMADNSCVNACCGKQLHLLPLA